MALLLATGALYLWGLGASGWANSFYSAAVQAGSESWKAFFFGSGDAANSITVDKTPFSLWPMALSVRLFGLSGWCILVPQALAGIATVALLHQVVRRSTGSAAAGLVAGSVMALTPVAVLMFRFNTPTRCWSSSWSAYVADGQIHYFLPSTGGGGDGGNSSEITSWVEAGFTATTVGSTTLYDLSGGIQ